MFKSIFLAFSFLTQVPLKTSEVKEKEVIQSLGFFPLVGLGEGFLLGLVALIGKFFFSLEITSFFCILVFILVRGVFHLDGLSDTVDALFVKSSGEPVKDREKRLKIMKDSTIGVGGGVALILNLLLRFILIKEILQKGFLFSSFILSSTLSKGLIVPVIYFSKPARSEGLGAFLITSITFREVFLALLFTLLIVLSGIYFTFSTVLEVIYFLFYLVLILFLSFLIKRLFEKRFLGLTGDNLGALMEFFELSFLFFWGEVWLRL